MKWGRKCPECGEELFYTRKWNRDRAEKRNTNCKSCIMESVETRKNMSESVSGKRNGMYGKFGEDNPLYGKKRSEETKLKMRLSRLKNIEKNSGQASPNYNKIGCEIIRWYNMFWNFNFRHAENGGEICIDGYFPDGVDEKRKTIIEIDEPRHFNADGTYKQKDIERQQYLESLGYTFIRIRV